MASGSIPFRSSILLRMDCSAVKAIALWFNVISLNWQKFDEQRGQLFDCHGTTAGTSLINN